MSGSRSLSENDISVYREFMQHGKVLSSPPIIIEQNAYNCGFYAAHCATQFHRDKQPGLFGQPALPARKSDVEPRAKCSLRALGKLKKFTIIGEMFSAQNLGIIVNDAGCQQITCNIDSYSQFISVIKIALDMDLPVIMPFSSDVGRPPGFDNNGARAHWATIIGHRNVIRDYSVGIGEKDPSDVLLTAQYGKYIAYSAFQYYNAFYNIQPVFPQTFFLKDKSSGKSVWTRQEQQPEAATTAEVHHVPKTDLTEFRRRLIVVMPPGFNMHLWDKKMQELAKESEYEEASVMYAHLL